MQRRLPRHRRQRVALQDVQRLADGRAAARRRPHAVDIEPAVPDTRRHALGRQVRLQVARGHQARAPGVVGRRGDRGVLHGLDERVRHGPPVEAFRPQLRDPLIRARQVGIAQDRPHIARRAIWVEIQRRGRRDIIEVVNVLFRLIEERLVHYEAVAGDADRRPQRGGKRDRPVPRQRLVPALHRAGHTHREAAEARVVEGQRAAAFPERIGPHRRRRTLPAVDRRHLPVVRTVDDHEAPAADPGRERLGDPEDGGRGDRRVDGVATATQRVDGSLRCQGVDSRGSPAGSRRGRRTMRSRVREGSDL